jgi:YVTN family beta-propeller protein
MPLQRVKQFPAAWTLAAAVLLSVIAMAQTAAADTAYVTSLGADNVSVIDTTSNAVVAPPIGVGDEPIGVAVSPDGSRAYVANFGSGSVSVIDTASNAVVASPIVGETPFGVAVTPDGSRVYVSNYEAESISVIDTSTNATIGSVPLGQAGPGVLAVSPDGSRVYVANHNAGTVSVIDTSNNLVSGLPIVIGERASALAPTPGGNRLYVADSKAGSVSVIDTASHVVAGSPIGVGEEPVAIALAPDGSRAYVVNSGDGSVSVIDTATNTVGGIIPVGEVPFGVAFTADGSHAYVSNNKSESVSVINAATNTATGTEIPVPTAAAIAINPPAAAIPPVQAPRPRRGTALAAHIARVKRGRALLRLRCRGGRSCSGMIKLIAAVRAKRGTRRRRPLARQTRRVVIGKAPFRLAAGKARVIRIELRRRGRRLLRHARRHRLKVRVGGRGVKPRTILLKQVQRHRKSRAGGFGGAHPSPGARATGSSPAPPISR